MDIKDVFNKAEEAIRAELEGAQEKEQKEELKLNLKLMDLYRQTKNFTEFGYKQLIKDIEADNLIEGERVSCTHRSKDEEHILHISCMNCGATTFNLLDKDYVEIYERYSYCLECAMCGQRKWYKLDKAVFEKVRKLEEAYETYDDYKEEME